MNVWLDDARRPPEGWRWVRTPEEAIALLGTGEVERISLDHDLGLPWPRTGYKALLWIEERTATNGFAPPAVMTVHSANPVGRRRMLQAIAKIREYEQRNAGR